MQSDVLLARYGPVLASKHIGMVTDVSKAHCRYFDCQNSSSSRELLSPVNP